MSHRARIPLLWAAFLFNLPCQTTADVPLFAVSSERVVVSGVIDGTVTQLETKLYRPEGSEPRPLIIFSHGRDGLNPPRNPNELDDNAALCMSLARRGFIVDFLVRRGYGNSDGPDTELQDTAIASGMEAVKSYRAALDYWRAQSFVLPDKIVLMGQSQGGWAVLTCTNVNLPGVLGVVNISGGTNFKTSMNGLEARNAHWVESCRVLGAGARVPSFWIYAENDLSIPGITARSMFNAFTGSGGPATLLMLPPFGSNGHQIVGTPSLFVDELDTFLARLGFSTPAPSFPEVSISGPTVGINGAPAVFEGETAGNPAPKLIWRKDGMPLAESDRVVGVNSAVLTIRNVQDSDRGKYVLVATNSSGSTFSHVFLFTTRDAPVQAAVADGDARTHIVNLSTRGVVGPGENALIAGFIISGSEAKSLLIAASGFNLRRFGLAGEIGRPRISLHHNVDGNDVVLAQNSDWQLNQAGVAPAMASIGQELPANSTDPAHGDAALVITLLPGAYTAVVDPDPKSANQDGIGLVELFDLSPETQSHLTNISSRGSVQTGARQMIVGVVTRGPGPSRLLIRAIGPTLKGFGVVDTLANPAQSLFLNGAASTALDANDDWWVSAQTDQLRELMPKMGLFAFDPQSTDSALLTLLPPGAYTSIISPSDGESVGVALTEIYDANGF